MRVLVGGAGALVTLVSVLGCSGLGGEGKSSLLGKVEFRVADNGIPADMKRGAAPASTSARVRDGQYVMKLKEGAGKRARVDGGRLDSDNRALADAASKTGLKNVRRVHGEPGSARYSGDHADMLHVESDRDIGSLRAELGSDAEVEWIEPVIEYDAFGSPNDEYYSYQWNMAVLDLPAVMQKQTGKGITVAVVDSGVSPGQDGFANLVRGYDFFDDDADPSDTDADKLEGGSHGTHVAGTIAQATGNGIGVSGLAPDVSIMPVRVMGWMPSIGTITSDNETIAAGIVWAADNGADVINMSLGGYTESEAIADALDYAYRKNVVVVAASGNNGYSDMIAFPASHPTVISVGAVDGRGQEPAYSNTSRLLDLCAPGGDLTVDADGDGYSDGIVQETLVGNEYGYVFMQGTSMASPHVAAAAALLRANGLRTPDEVREALTSTVTAIAGKSYGTLNVLAALGYTPRGGSRVGKSGGDRGARGGDAAARGGDAAARGGDAAARGGDAGARGGAGAAEGRDASTGRGGEGRDGGGARDGARPDGARGDGGSRGGAGSGGGRQRAEGGR